MLTEPDALKKFDQNISSDQRVRNKPDLIVTMDTTQAATPVKVEEKEAIQYAFSMESKRLDLDAKVFS